MSNYVANEWQNGDKIYAEDMNRIDGGVEDLYNTTDDLQEQINELEPGGGSDAFVLNLVCDDAEVSESTGLVSGTVPLDSETVAKLEEWFQSETKKQIIVNGTLNSEGDFYASFQAVGFSMDIQEKPRITSPLTIVWSNGVMRKTMFNVEITPDKDSGLVAYISEVVTDEVTLEFLNVTRLGTGFISANVFCPIGVDRIKELLIDYSVQFKINLNVDNEEYNWRITNVAVCNGAVTITTPIYFNTYSQSYNIIVITGDFGEDADQWRFEEIKIADPLEH